MKSLLTAIHTRKNMKDIDKAAPGYLPATFSGLDAPKGVFKDSVVNKIAHRAQSFGGRFYEGDN